MQDNLNNLDKTDEITKTFSQFVKILLLGNPQKTALGGLLGFAIRGLANIFFQWNGLNLSADPFSCVALGILLLNINNLFSNASFDADLEKFLRYIQLEHKMGNFTKAQERDHWKKFDEMVVKKITESIEQGNTGQSDKDKDRTVKN